MNWRKWCGDAIIVPVNAGIIGERHSNLKEDQKIMKRRKKEKKGESLLY